MKRIITMLLLTCLLLALPIPAAAAGESDHTEGGKDMNIHQYGFHVENGVIMLEGKPFYGFGVNYFGAFTHYEDGYLPDPQVFKDGFAGMAEHNIPFVRIALGYYSGFYDRYDQDPQGTLNKIREVLDAAEAQHVGVVLSLFWHDAALAEHVGEKRADMGEGESRTLAYAQEFTATIVKEFADHRALWGWEIGNEYNLDADLCDRNLQGFLPGGFTFDNPSGRDYFTSGETAFFFEAVASTIREYDGYRMISNGCSEMRTCAWNMHKATVRLKKDHLWDINWNQDTRTDFERIVALYTPDSVDTMSFHFQSGSSGAAEPSYTLSYPVFAGEEALTVPGFLDAYVQAAKSAGKALYLGEFGDFRDMESAEDCPEMFRTLCGWVSDAGIQIASLWQFQDYVDSGVGGEKLDILSEINTALKESGKLYTDVAWGLAEDTEDTEDTEETSADSPAADESETPTDAVTDPSTPSETESPDVSETDAPASGGCGSTASLWPVVLAGLCLPVMRRRRRRHADF
ncbi:MAG: cellulase family glycosylhydrolase [Clostridia bacterium]|nr:cellulase family glycosylhydrolase [Clostridia bacterium]